MLITQKNFYQEGTRRRTVKKELTLGPLSLKFLTLALLAVVGLFYIAQSTQASAQKYKIIKLQDSRHEVEAQTKELEVEAARLKSLNEIKNSAQSLNLESYREID